MCKDGSKSFGLFPGYKKSNSERKFEIIHRVIESHYEI